MFVRGLYFILLDDLVLWSGDSVGLVLAGGYRRLALMKVVMLVS